MILSYSFIIPCELSLSWYDVDQCKVLNSIPKDLTPVLQPSTTTFLFLQGHDEIEIPSHKPMYFGYAIIDPLEGCEEISFFAWIEGAINIRDHTFHHETNRFKFHG